MSAGLIVFVACLALFHGAQSATVEFSGTNYDFSDTTSETFTWSATTTWASGSAPASGDDVVIGRCGYVADTLCNFDNSATNEPPKVIDIGSSTITIRSLRFAATNVVIRGTSNAQLIITNGLTWNAGFFDVKVVVSGASKSYDKLDVEDFSRRHGLMGSNGLLQVAANTFQLLAQNFKMWNSGRISVTAGATLQVIPPYDRSPVSNSYVEIGADDRTALPYPSITNAGTISFDAQPRVGFLDSCVLFASITSTGTISASAPACIVQQEYVDATTNPAATSTLNGPFTFTLTGNIHFYGGSFQLGSALSTGTSTATNYVKFGEKNDPNVLSSSANGWTYLRTSAAITVGTHFWLDGTAYLSGSNKVTFSRLTFSAGALVAPVDVTGAFVLKDNLVTGSTPIGYLANKLTFLTGSSALFDRTPDQYQEEQDSSSLVMRPGSEIVISTGVTATVNFVPLVPAAGFTGTAPKVTNQGTLLFNQPNNPGFWRVFVDNQGTLRTGGSPRSGFSTDYAALLFGGGVNSGTINFPGAVGVALQNAWSHTSTAQFTGGATIGYLTHYPDTQLSTAANTMSLDGNLNIFSLEIAASDGRIETTPTGTARQINIANFIGGESTTFAGSNSKYTLTGTAFLGTILYRLNLESTTLEVASQTTFTIQGAFVKATTESSRFINRGVINIVSEGGLNSEDSMGMHLINHNKITIKGGSASFGGLVSKSILEFVTDPAATAGSGLSSPISKLYWQMALILNQTNTLTMNIYQRPLLDQSYDQIIPGSEVLSGTGFVKYGQYCYLDGVLKLQFKTIGSDSWTPTVGDEYDLLLWHPSRPCDGTFSSLTSTGLPSGTGVKIVWSNSRTGDQGLVAVICSTTSDSACNTITTRPAGTRGPLDPAILPFLDNNIPSVAVVQSPPPADAVPISPPVAPAPRARAPSIIGGGGAPTAPPAPTSGNAPQSGGQTPSATGTPTNLNAPQSSGGNSPTEVSTNPLPAGSQPRVGAPSSRILSGSAQIAASALCMMASVLIVALF